MTEFTEEWIEEARAILSIETMSICNPIQLEMIDEIERLQAQLERAELLGRKATDALDIMKAHEIWGNDDLVAEEKCEWINENETNTSIRWAFGCTKLGTYIEDKSDKSRLIRCPNCYNHIRYIEENND